MDSLPICHYIFADVSSNETRKFSLFPKQNHSFYPIFFFLILLLQLRNITSIVQDLFNQSIYQIKFYCCSSSDFSFCSGLHVFISVFSFFLLPPGRSLYVIERIEKSTTSLAFSHSFSMTSDNTDY